MKEKVLVLDLDGTAITNDYVLTEELIGLCNELEKKMDIIIATGRSVSDGFRYYKKLNLSNYMICYNGAYIWNPSNNSVEHCNYMKNAGDTLTYILDNFERFGIENIIVSSGINTYVLNDKNKFMCDMMYDEKFPFIYVTRTFMEKLEKVHRMVLSCKTDIASVQNKIKSLSNSIDIFSWKGRDDIIDISMADVNKFWAVERLISKEGISMKNVIAFGDGKNDIPILKEAGIGVAMINANDEVKKNADFVTRFDNQNNGIYRFFIENMELF
jgi:hypothetical protein